MKLQIDNKEYPIEIEKKRTNKNTYIRVKKNMTIQVTTNYFTTEKTIKKLIEDNIDKIKKMLAQQETKNKNNTGFFYLGKKYDIVYVEYCDIKIGENKVFLNKNLDLDKWYKYQAKVIFKDHLDVIYHRFSKKIPYPELKIRKMTSRWGVCNTKTKTVTLNLELMKRDTKYLDYVIVHELSHLIHANHSSKFWDLVEENMPDYKEYRKEMKDF